MQDLVFAYSCYDAQWYLLRKEKAALVEVADGLLGLEGKVEDFLDPLLVI